MRTFYLKVIVAAIAFLTPYLVVAQILSDQQIDESKISPWIADDKSAYAGTYSFGFSESESKAVLSVNSKEVTFIVNRTGEELYGPDGSFGGWKLEIDTYTNVLITGNKFYSDQSNGEFKLYDNGKILKRCLKLLSPPNDFYNGQYELGEKYQKPSEKASLGKYPIASTEFLSSIWLEKLPSKELKIMRNEIFARHGYIFKAGGAMDEYFRVTTWYEPTFENVDHLLSVIEKRNIKHILEIEKRKN